MNGEASSKRTGVLISQQAIDVSKEKSRQIGYTTKNNEITKVKPRKRNKRESISFSGSEDFIFSILMDSDNSGEFLDTLSETEPEVEVDANEEEDKDNSDPTGIVNVSVGY
ncbi:hypothetical protein JTB14_030854 [Gonioctena quinquepunctata]|nr:hypothetical protein JTB14_030854 [Gonioctena quinquepunctata]